MTGAPPLDMTPLALSMGDPAGIGPEIIVQAWLGRVAGALPPFFVVGLARALAGAAARYGVPLIPIETPADAGAVFTAGLPVLDVPIPGGGPLAVRPGEPDAGGARVALAALDHAITLCLDGQARALVTAPVSKAGLAAVGFRAPGQTEHLAARCGIAADDTVMMLTAEGLAPPLRVVPLTTHIPLKTVPKALTMERILGQARVVRAALRRDFAIVQPRLAFAGLNPHAGEGGLMGDEESRVLAPAIARLRAEGITLAGPLPADTLFHARARAEYDAVLCAYHDQALIPLKTLAFDDGVNVTLGLPIIRTSPDHGTAFAIAGKGTALPDAMIAAIQLAATLAGRRAIPPVDDPR